MKKIQLSQGKFALVDDADFEWLNQWKWCAVKGATTYYVRRTENKKGILMHRLILGLTNPKILGDHKDHNGLNNQRSNIRKCTPQENTRNRIGYGSSKYLGVSRHKSKLRRVNKKGEMIHYCSEQWLVHIQVNRKCVHIGTFKDEKDAARAFNEAAQKHYGEFANLNQL